MAISLFIRTALTGSCALILTSAAAHAAGFYIQEQSVSGLGSAFSGAVTNTQDASTIYFNPAGLTQFDRRMAQAGVHVLVPTAKLRDTGTTVNGVASGGNNGGNPYDPSPIPNLFVSTPVTDKLSMGFGVTAPFGLASECNTGWFGRFDSTKTELTVIDYQPTLAYKFSDIWSVGLGLNFMHGDADLRKAVTNVVSEGTQILTGDDWGFGYTLGVQYRPTESTTWGLNYKSESHFDLEGRAVVSGLTAGNFNLEATAALVTPDILSFGVSHKVNDRWTVQGQMNWFGWSNFEDITVAFKTTGTTAAPVRQNYDDTMAFAVGAEYKASDKWLLRGGLQYDETPTGSFRTTLTPDGDRIWVSGGATYKINPATSLDLAATYIDIASESINVVRTPAVVRASTEGHVGILALGLNYRF